MSDEIRAAELEYTRLRRKLDETEEQALEKWDTRKECFMSASYKLRHSDVELVTVEEIKSMVHRNWRSELPALEDALSGLPERFRSATAVQIIDIHLNSMQATVRKIVGELRHEVAEAKKKADGV